MEMKDVSVSEEKCEAAGVAGAAAAVATATTAPIPVGALRYGEPYTLRLNGWSKEAFVSPASDEYVFLRPENPMTIIFVSADGVEAGAPIRTHERLRIQSFYGILHGYDSKVWLAWSRKSERDGFMLEIPGRAAGAVITMATNFTILSSHPSWKGCQVIGFPGGKHLGLCVPGTKYRIWGVSELVQFRAAPSTPSKAVRYKGQDIVFERVLPSDTVGAFKTRIAKRVGVDVLKMAVMLKSSPSSAKGFLLSDDAMPLYMMRVGRGVLMLNIRGARSAAETATSDHLTEATWRRIFVSRVGSKIKRKFLSRCFSV